MRRGVLVVLVALGVLAVAPGTVAATGNVTETGVAGAQLAADGSSVADIDGDSDNEIVFLGSGTVKYHDLATNTTTSTGASAAEFVVGDVTNDGRPDVVFRDSSNNLKYYDDSAGTTTNTGAQVDGSSLTTGDANNDGDIEIVFGDTNRNLKYRDTSAGTTTNTGVDIIVGSYLSAGEIQNGGAEEIAFVATGFTLKYYDVDNGATSSTGVSGFQPKVANVDGDGLNEIAFRDASDNLKYFDVIGGVTDTGEQAEFLSTGDINGDGDTEIGFDDPAGTYQFRDVASATTTDTGIAAGSNKQVAVGDVTTDGEAELVAIRSGTIVYYDTTNSAPTLSTITPADGTVVERTQQLTATVNDSDLGVDIDESVTVEFLIDGAVVGSDTLTANGTASTVWDAPTAGDRNYTVRATDTGGAAAASTPRTLRVPSRLTLRNESTPSQVITTQSNATIRFFGSSGTVAERTTTTGQVNMTGLPADERFVASISANGYRDRRVVIESLFEQQSVYLLSSSAPAFSVEFQLQDNTGQFPTSETTLVVSKPIERNNSTEFRNLAGDRYGSTDTLPFEIRQNERVRLELRNEDGDVRKLGSFTVSRDAVVPLEVGQLEFPIRNEDTYRANATREEVNATTDRLVFEYSDRDNLTSEIQIRIVDAENDSRVLTTDREVGEFGTYRFQTLISGTEKNQTWRVEYNATRVGDGDDAGGRLLFGAERYPVNIPIDDGWRQIFAVGLILTVAGLFSVANARIGALVVPGVGAVLWYIGWMSGIAGASAIVVALSLGVAYNLAISRGVPA